MTPDDARFSAAGDHCGFPTARSHFKNPCATPAPPNVRCAEHAGKDLEAALAAGRAGAAAPSTSDLVDDLPELDEVALMALDDEIASVLGGPADPASTTTRSDEERRLRQSEEAKEFFAPLGGAAVLVHEDDGSVIGAVAHSDHGFLALYLSVESDPRTGGIGACRILDIGHLEDPATAEDLLRAQWATDVAVHAVDGIVRRSGTGSGFARTRRIVDALVEWRRSPEGRRIDLDSFFAALNLAFEDAVGDTVPGPEDLGWLLDDLGWTRERFALAPLGASLSALVLHRAGDESAVNVRELIASDVDELRAAIKRSGDGLAGALENWDFAAGAPRFSAGDADAVERWRHVVSWHDVAMRTALRMPCPAMLDDAYVPAGLETAVAALRHGRTYGAIGDPSMLVDWIDTQDVGALSRFVRAVGYPENEPITVGGCTDFLLGQLFAAMVDGAN